MRTYTASWICLVGILAFSTCQNITITDDTQAETPTFDAVDGTYVAPKTVSITSSTADASIRYTLDGTAPSKTAGTLYSSPLELTAAGTVTIKAVAYTETLLASPLATATYKIIPLIISPPATVTASPANASVSIAWTAVEGATGYNVYYKAGAAAAKTDTKSSGSPYTGTTATVSGLTNGTAYAFIVTAYDADAESDASSVVTATPSLVVPPPMAPVLLPLSREVGKTTADWNPVTGASSYTLYFSVGATVSKTAYDQVVPSIPSTSTEYEVTGLTNNQEYAFIVTATNAGGEGNASDIQRVKPGIAGAPTSVTVTALSSSSARLAWTTPESVITISGYKVYRSTTEGDSNPTYYPPVIAASPYNDSGLTGGTTYYYWVKTTTLYGDSDFSQSASVTIPTLDLPGAPTASATAHATIKKVDILIGAPTTGGTPASYSLYRGTSPGEQGSTPLASGLSAGTYTDTDGLVAGTTYYYKASATNAIGEGPRSAETNATGSVPPTPAIAGNVASRGFIVEYTRYSFLANAITISNTNATGAVVTHGATTVFSGAGTYTNSAGYDAAGAGFTANQTVSWSGHTYNGWGDSATATASSTFPPTLIGATTITTSTSTGVIDISCTDVAGDGEYYAVYRRLSSTELWTLWNTYTGSFSNYAMGGLTAGTYYVCIVAFHESSKYVGTRVVNGPISVP